MTHAFLDSERLGEGSRLIGWPLGGADVRYVRPFMEYRNQFGTNIDARHMVIFMGQFETIGTIWDTLHQAIYGIFMLLCMFAEYL